MLVSVWRAIALFHPLNYIYFLLFLHHFLWSICFASLLMVKFIYFDIFLGRFVYNCVYVWVFFNLFLLSLLTFLFRFNLIFIVQIVFWLCVKCCIGMKPVLWFIKLNCEVYYISLCSNWCTHQLTRAHTRGHKIYYMLGMLAVSVSQCLLCRYANGI